LNDVTEFIHPMNFISNTSRPRRVYLSFHLYSWFRTNIVGLLAMFAWLLPIPSLASAGNGYLDTVHYDTASQVLSLSGWAAPELPNVYTSNVIVLIGGQKVYQGTFLRFERPDVVNATQRPDWLWSGWRLEARVPGLPAGKQDVQVRFLLTDGQSFDLQSMEDARSIDVPARRTPSTKALFLVVLAIILPALAYAFPTVAVSMTRRRCHPELVFAVAVTASFFCLVASGVSGSSIRLALKDSPLLSHDAVSWQGEARSIRWDEWNILTQMAIGQTNVPERFPVVNNNVGLDGNNMLIIGMTGVPVSHVSSFAKPATWGFWVFDLRRALSWHWWLPFFGCFLALWSLMIRFFGLSWRVAAVLSLSVTASPYSLVFSGHPAYTVFFPALSLVVLDTILNTSRQAIALALGLLLGMCLAGFVFVLYLPWQITLMYLMLPLAAVHWISHRKEWLFGRTQVLSLIVAVIVFVALVGAWLLDTKDVLQTVASTVYPGQRSTSVGGDIDPWFFVKGLLNPVTLYQESSMMSASAAGSFVWIWIPLIVATGMVCWKDRKLHATPLAIIGFMVVALIYIHIGFPRSLAEFTLWGRVTSHRIDLALGLAQCLLLAWLISAKDAESLQMHSKATIYAALGMAGVCVILAIWQFGLIPFPIVRELSPGFMVAAIMLLGTVTYLLVAGWYEWAAGIYCAWMVAPALLFNPVDQAPSQVSLDPAFKSVIQTAGGAGVQTRLAVLDTNLWTMNLVAVGIPTVNAVLYYPQPTLWKSLDPTGAHKIQYNRYQNLDFTSRELPEDRTFQIDSPQLDRVRVTMDPRRFDFRKLGATHVLTSPETASRLISNPSVRSVAMTERWAVLKVVSP
jgi:hypothetical protein